MNANTMYEQCMSMDESEFAQFINQNKESITDATINEFAEMIGGSTSEQLDTIHTIMNWMN